ncbi:hypothetical protein VPH35_012296 [Triticum aestivum]|uniref:TAK19-1 n=1 Tax=Triticum aestivum TaxID=4565 RepID=D0QEK1_WHEAT|nr:TAK19-1 [Triticum aestivum]
MRYPDLRIHHVNVVRLVGLCSEEIRRALVYEHMPKCSLDNHCQEDQLPIQGVRHADSELRHQATQHRSQQQFCDKGRRFWACQTVPEGQQFRVFERHAGDRRYIAPEMISRSFGVISSKSEMWSRDRPTMSEVIETLEAGVDGLQMLLRPFFCDEGHIHVEDSYHFTSEPMAVSKEELSAVSEEDDV